ncbi:MAG TPA: Ribosomal RNA small subunit methyltransferase C [Hyphomicrobiaceae bacterium MAG_BT-2024]
MPQNRAIYGQPFFTLPDQTNNQLQISPRVPGAIMLENITAKSLDSIIIHAPENTLERQYVLARSLFSVKPYGSILAFASKTKGGARLAKEFAKFGCNVEVNHQSHYKITACQRPTKVQKLDAAINAGSPRYEHGIGFWTQPGLFSWNRIDPASALLISNLPPLEGVGADLGCGYGILAKSVLGTGLCRKLILIDIDRRALAMAERNVGLRETETIWTDIRLAKDMPTQLDFVITNPPFHENGIEDRKLGCAFINKAAAMLKPTGILWITANRHLPYENLLNVAFSKVMLITQNQWYKVYKASK